MVDTKVCPNCGEIKPFDDFKFKKPKCHACQLQQARDWKAKNKERANELTRKWKAENQDKVKAYNSAYFAENKETIRPKSNAYHQMRRQEDPSFKLAKSLRTRYGKVLKENRLDESSLLILGCSIECFRTWLEFGFSEEMTFKNHGKIWQLDHVVPIAKFELIDDNGKANEEEIRKCFHWTNFQPLTSMANKIKNSNLTTEDVIAHESRLNEFLQSLTNDERGQYTIIEIDRMSYISKPTRKRFNRGATKVDMEVSTGDWETKSVRLQGTRDLENQQPSSPSSDEKGEGSTTRREWAVETCFARLKV